MGGDYSDNWSGEKMWVLTAFLVGMGVALVGRSLIRPLYQTTLFIVKWGLICGVLTYLLYLSKLGHEEFKLTLFTDLLRVRDGVVDTVVHHWGPWCVERIKLFIDIP